MNKVKNTLVYLLSLALVVLCIVSGNDEAEKDIFAMDTYINIKITGKEAREAMKEAEEEILRLDKMLDVNGEGELKEVNLGGNIGKEMLGLISRCTDISEKTGGAFDITVYPVLKLWGFTTDKFHVPDMAEIERKMSFVGYEKIARCEQGLPPGMEIDFGGAAKGYAADRIKTILDRYNIKSAVISFGGTVLSYGKTHRIAVKDPYDGIAASFEAKDVTVSTSGGYERYFDDAGKRYGHILDPKTGLSAESGILSATAVSGDGLLSDALSTAVYVLGEEGARELFEKELFEGIIITDNGRIIITEKIAPTFKGGEKYKIEIWTK